MNRRPPRFPEWLFSRLLPDEVREDVLGDLEERFNDRRKASENAARMWYRGQVLWGLPRLVCAMLRGGKRVPATSPGLHTAPSGGLVVWSDIRHAAGIAIREPAFSATAIVVLALGVAATTTMFSIVHGMFRPLPLENQEEVVRVARHDPVAGYEYMATPEADFGVLRAQQASLVDVAAVDDHEFQLSSGSGRPDRVPGAEISSWAFDLLRVRATIGRTLLDADADPAAPPVVVLSHQLWQSRFGGSREVVGQEVRLNDEVRTVVGVMPEHFGFPLGADLWVPLSTAPSDISGPTGSLDLFGRLRPGVTVAEASLALGRIGERLATATPESNTNARLVVEPFLDRWVRTEDRVITHVMLLLASFVLLIAAANVTNLLLSRAVVRRKEVAVRMALGGSRLRVLSLGLMESLTLSTLGGALGFGLSIFAVAAFDRAVAPDLGRYWWMIIQVDGAAVLFTGGCVLAASLVAGLLPAVQSSGVDLQSVMRSESAGSTRFRQGRVGRVLVGGQVTLSCALLILCGMMILGSRSLDSVEYAFEADRVLAGRVVLEAFDYPDHESRMAFQRSMEERLGAIPGVDAVAFSTNLPGAQGGYQYAVEGTVNSPDQALPIVEGRYVSPAAFEMFGLTLHEGRLIRERDRDVALRIAVVNEQFEREVAGNGSALGLRFRLSQSDDDWIQIVGVVADVGVSKKGGKNVAGIFLPMWDSPGRGFSVAVSTDTPIEVLPRMLETLALVDPNLPVRDLEILRETLWAANGPERVFAVLFGAFGSIALALAVVGLYGVVAFGVNQRAREFGVRRALGASSADVQWWTVRSGLLPLAIGLGLGTGIAWLLAPNMVDMLFGTNPHDFKLFSLVPAVLAGAAAIGLWLPARRAAQMDPMAVLRGE